MITAHELTQRIAQRAADLTNVSREEIAAELGPVAVAADGQWRFSGRIISSQVRAAVEQAIRETRATWPAISPQP